jgi:hypothetical protein
VFSVIDVHFRGWVLGLGQVLNLVEIIFGKLAGFGFCGLGEGFIGVGGSLNI